MSIQKNNVSLQERLGQAASQFSSGAIVELVLIFGMVSYWFQRPNEIPLALGGAAAGAVLSRLFSKQQPLQDDVIALREITQQLLSSVNADDQNLLESVERLLKALDTSIH